MAGGAAEEAIERPRWLPELRLPVVIAVSAVSELLLALRGPPRTALCVGGLLASTRAERWGALPVRIPRPGRGGDRARRGGRASALGRRPGRGPGPSLGGRPRRRLARVQGPGRPRPAHRGRDRHRLHAGRKRAPARLRPHGRPRPPPLAPGPGRDRLGRGLLPPLRHHPGPAALAHARRLGGLGPFHPSGAGHAGAAGTGRWRSSWPAATWSSPSPSSPTPAPAAPWADGWRRSSPGSSPPSSPSRASPPASVWPCSSSPKSSSAARPRRWGWAGPTPWPRWPARRRSSPRAPHATGSAPAGRTSPPTSSPRLPRPHGAALAGRRPGPGSPARALAWVGLCSPAEAAVALLLPRGGRAAEPSRPSPTTA